MSAPSDQEKSTSGPEYYPFKISYSGTTDPKQHSFLVSGKDEKRVSTQGQVLNLFLKHRMKIVSHWGYTNEDRREFVLCLNCDMRNSDITPDGLVLELRLLKAVRNARSIRMQNRLFDGFFFPIMLLENRVLILDSQFPSLIERELKAPEQKAAIAEVGRIYALDIIRQIRSKLPPYLPEKILQENVLDYFKAAGIGRFNLLVEEKSIQATIRDPPLSERGDAMGNHFIHGIVVGIIESLYERETKVVEDLFDPRTGRLFIVLLDKRNVAISSEQTARSDAKIRALEEIEKVISSIEGETKPQAPMTATASTPTTLNQVLKAYENDGWIGGKISYAPNPAKESSVPIVVKYYDELKVGETTKEASVDQSISTQLSGVSKKLELSKTEIAPKVLGEKLRKKADEEKEEDDNRMRNAFKSSIGEDGDFYFEESDLLD